MLLKVAGILASIPLATGGMVAATGIAVIDVREASGTRVVVPVPLMMAEMAVRLMPERAMQVALERTEPVRAYLPAAEEALAALADSPDAELVSVEDGDQRIRINKVGGMLEVRIDGRGDDVAVNIPLAAVQRVVRSAHHGGLEAGDLVAALRQARRTDLVEVVDGGDRVKISIW